MTTVAAVLAAAQAQGVERLDAQRLLSEVLGQTRTWLLTHDDHALSPEQGTQLQTLFNRLKAGEPMAYLMGRQEFHGLELLVSPAVLVPRPDTETLVDWALALLAPDARDEVLDLGTGSGAIALALQDARPDCGVTAVDTSGAALAQARANATRLGLPVRFAQGDWWQAVAAAQRFRLVVSNPPYIAGGDPHLAALQHEPQIALTPGGDGLDAIRAIVAGAPQHLEPGGWLLIEHGYDQAEAVADLLRRHGFCAVQHRHDLAGHTRCTGGSWP